MKGTEFEMGHAEKTLTQWQEKVGGFAKSAGFSEDAFARFIDLTSEIGELGKELLKASDYGKNSFESTLSMADEFGDCLFSLLYLGELLQMDVEAALTSALKKYEERVKATGKAGSGR